MVLWGKSSVCMRQSSHLPNLPPLTLLKQEMGPLYSPKLKLPEFLSTAQFIQSKSFKKEWEPGRRILILNIQGKQHVLFNMADQ